MGRGALAPPHLDPHVAFHQRDFGAGFGHPSWGVCGAPPGPQIGVQIGAEMVSEGAILRSKFDPKSRPQNETEKLAY